MLPENLVYAHMDEAVLTYPKTPPFSPSEAYPEYQFGGVQAEANPVYGMVRQLLAGLGMDFANFGTAGWNPMGEIVKPGDTVLVKPNLVRDYHGYGWDLASVVAHGSIIRAVVDFVFIALKGQGSVTVGDAPLQSTDFISLLAQNGINEIQQFYADKGMTLRVVDFRRERAKYARVSYPFRTMQSIIITGTEDNGGDPLGYAAVNVGDASMHRPNSEHYRRHRVTNYDPDIMFKHHNESVDEYLIPKTVLTSDVVINIAKMKTHRKAGLTAALKNLVGINGNKDWLPHHKIGTPEEGGDEYKNKSVFKMAATWATEKEDVVGTIQAKHFMRQVKRAFTAAGMATASDPYREGSWYGNDTIWRTILDLNRILIYGTADGSLKSTPQRRVFSIVDGIIAGDHEGPLEPTAKPCGLLVGGQNPVVTDAAICRMMGFDYRKLPVIKNGFTLTEFPICGTKPDEINIRSNSPVIDGIPLDSGGKCLDFEPSAGWKGHIELG